MGGAIVAQGDVVYQSGAGVTKNLTGLVTEEAAAQGLARVQRSSDATVADLLNQLVESGKAGLQGEKEAAEAVAGSIDKVVKAMAAQSAKAEQAASTASGRKLELPIWCVKRVATAPGRTPFRGKAMHACTT